MVIVLYAGDFAIGDKKKGRAKQMPSFLNKKQLEVEKKVLLSAGGSWVESGTKILRDQNSQRQKKTFKGENTKKKNLSKSQKPKEKLFSKGLGL